MCLIAIDWKTHPDWPLVLAGNRDERHVRPTASATFWPTTPEILAGRDLSAGGTWLGVNVHTARFAAVTNYREPNASASNARSRGQLINRFLQGQMSAAAFAAETSASGTAYGGFNLFIGTRDALYYVCNREGLLPRALKPGRYALSNATLDTPWPKVERMRNAFSDERDAQPRPDIDRLFALFDDREAAADDELPDTGLNVDVERRLSAPFIVHPEFGTRTTTVLAMGGHRIHFAERHFDPTGKALETRRFLITQR